LILILCTRTITGFHGSGGTRIPPGGMRSASIFEEPEDTVGQVLPQPLVRLHQLSPSPGLRNLHCHLHLLMYHRVAPPQESCRRCRCCSYYNRHSHITWSSNCSHKKAYSCWVCGKPITSQGHTQFRGQQYCPDAPGQLPKEEWLQRRKPLPRRGHRQHSNSSGLITNFMIYTILQCFVHTYM
jgi:hypothetical protein